MNKKMSILLSGALIAGLLAGCGAKDSKTTASPSPTPAAEQSFGTNQNQKWADGTYYAADDKFDEKYGWKEAVILKVKDGKITDANWTTINVNGGADKKEASKDGTYGMKKNGKAQSEWHEQAEKVEKYLIEKQDPKAIKYKDDEGHTDAISGVSIHVKNFFTLADKALLAGPAKEGQYKDGGYHAEGQADKDGWVPTVDLTVLNGNIVAANWDSVKKDTNETKKQLSKDGKYGMKEKGKAQGEWHEEIAKAEQFLIDNQDPAKFQVKDDGKTDAVSGVTVHVNDYVSLTQKALDGAKK